PQRSHVGVAGLARVEDRRFGRLFRQPADEPQSQPDGAAPSFFLSWGVPSIPRVSRAREGPFSRSFWVCPQGEKGPCRSRSGLEKKGMCRRWDWLLRILGPHRGHAPPLSLQVGRGRRYWLQRAVPVAGVDIGMAHLNTVLARVAYQLRWLIEAHRLTVEDGGAEGVRIVALDPGRYVDQVREARRVALRKAILAEPFDLAA